MQSPVPDSPILSANPDAVVLWGAFFFALLAVSAVAGDVMQMASDLVRTLFQLRGSTAYLPWCKTQGF